MYCHFLGCDEISSSSASPSFTDCAFCEIYLIFFVHLFRLIVKATYITCTTAAWDILVRCSSYQIHKLIIVFRRWSDVGNNCVYNLYHLHIWANELSWGCTIFGRDIPWSDDGIYLDANRSMLSLGYDFQHTVFSLLSDTKARSVTLSPPFTIKWL